MQSPEFLLEGGPDAILLIHGLTGTPMEMRLVARGLQRRGFTVCGVRLAGHCGSMDDLLDTTWRDWAASVHDAARTLAARSNNLFVGGLSMGALLALDLAATHPQLVSGVAAYGATFRYDGWSIPALSRLTFLLPWVKRLDLCRDRVFMEQPPFGLRDERLRAQISTAMQGSDSSVAGLPGNPWHSLAELHLLSKHVRRNLHKVTAPCLVVHALEDDVASIENARIVLRGVHGPTEFVLLEDSYHMITIDREHRKVIEHTADFFDAIIAENALAQAA